MELSRSELELESLVRRIETGELDLQPDFQRGEIWDTKRRQRLIDSLLREWYVPAVYIVRTKGGGPEIVLDGQQRLAAIRDFFADMFPIDGTIEPRSESISQLDGIRFSDLPDAIRRRLRRFALPCVILREFEPEEPNELFFRLNQSYNLTPSEKRNALHGRTRVQVKSLINHLGDIGLLRPEVVGFNNRRLAYDDIVARTCLAIERDSLRQHINNTVVEKFYRESSFSDSTLDAVAKAGEQLYRLCLNSGQKLRFNKATLFSWLIASYWMPKVVGELPSRLLDDFESHRRALKRREQYLDFPPEFIGAMSLYDDRASYRVTDVTSVLARDCVIYLYLGRTHGAPSIRGSDDVLSNLAAASESAAQTMLLSYVAESNWGILSPERWLEK